MADNHVAPIILSPPNPFSRMTWRERALYRFGSALYRIAHPLEKLGERMTTRAAQRVNAIDLEVLRASFGELAVTPFGEIAPHVPSRAEATAGLSGALGLRLIRNDDANSS